MTDEYPYKTDLIRAVADRTSPLTNQQIKDEVLSRFGVEVSSCSVINTIGSWHKRITSNPSHIAHLKKLAQAYVTTVGDRSLAKRLVSDVQP
tara:strand:- start:804 stop:1079 length:276 start_codon:yes stop_codon:yes gene_type:complete